MRSVLRCTICRYLKNVMEQIPHYNNRRCFLPSCLKTVYTWMTLDLPENKPCASPYSECSRQWQSNPLCTTASSNTWWRNLPTWFWCSMLRSEFISAEVYLCFVFINTWTSPWMKNYILVEGYDKENPADLLKWREGSMCWEYLEIIFLFQFNFFN